MAAQPAIRELLLLRHAKSIPDDGSIPDFDRPLTPRGEKAAKAMGQEIVRLGLTPDSILCSPARRAAETWKILAEHANLALEAELEPRLYDFGNGDSLLALLAETDASVRRLMLVGHNPSLENLARKLIAKGNPQLRANLETKFPTAALAVIALSTGDWRKLDQAGGELTAFLRPRELAGD